MYIVCVGGMGSLTVTSLCWMCDHLEQLEWNISGMWSIYRTNHSGYSEYIIPQLNQITNFAGCCAFSREYKTQQGDERGTVHHESGSATGPSGGPSHTDRK